MNLSNAVVSDVYTVDPRTLKFDDKLVQFNEELHKEDFSALREQIKEYGQLTPIYIRNGLVIDGRHRSKACTELRIDVKAVDVDPSLKDEDAVVLVNTNIFTSRNNSVTQLAIKACKLVDHFGYSDTKAVAIVGLKNRRLLGYLRQIKASKFDAKFSVIETLLKGDTVTIVESCGKTFQSKSLEVIKRKIVMIEEDEYNETREEPTEPTVQYDDMLESETGKFKFWEMVKGNVINVESKLKIIGLLNVVYPKVPKSNKQ